jgi:gluconate 2-dehydrogenase gamma chain
METASPRVPADPPEGSSRRRFLGQAAATATVAFFWLEGVGDPLRRRRVEPTAPDAPRKTFSATEWRTLEAASLRILPSEEGSPGAREVNGIGYLDAVLQEPEILPDTVTRVRAGAARLDAHAKGLGASSFADLDADAMDAGIRLFEATWDDQRWLRTMISFLLEALLGDPVHGGNPGEIGWTWAQMKPVEPRPKDATRPTGLGGAGR